MEVMGVIKRGASFHHVPSVSDIVEGVGFVLVLVVSFGVRAHM